MPSFLTPLATIASAFLHLLAQVTVNVNAPVDVGPKDPVLVRVEVTAPAGRDIEVLAPSFAPFRVVTSTSIAGIDSGAQHNGAIRPVWQTVEHRYVLAPPAGASGRYVFGPFEVHVGAPGLREAITRSASWAVSVRTPPVVASTLPAIVDRARVEPSKGINFHALAVPETVYVGQQATYQVGVFLDETVRSRLRRNPEFLPPELRGLLAYELPAGRASLRDREIAGKKWDVHVFQRAVFPLEAGRTDVPPAQLTYSLPLSLGFFSREESYTARSEAATIVGIAPPAAGRPTDWVGAVGVLHTTTRVDTASARVGDPVVLTLRVEGTGNVKLLPRPPLALPWGTAVPGEERVSVDSGALLVRGAKEFDWIVTPSAAGEQTIPPIRYPYFDPYRRAYDVALSLEVPVHVVPGTLAAAVSTDSTTAQALAIRQVDRGPVRAPLPSRPLFWVLVLAAPLPAAVLVVARRPRRPVRGRTPDAVLRRAPRELRDDDVRGVRRTFGTALADRLALRDASAAIVSARSGVLARRLRRFGVTPETAAEVEALVHALDAAAYAANLGDGRTDARDLATRAVALYERVDREARTRVVLASLATRRQTVTRALAIAAVGIGGAAAVARALPDGPAASFAQGVSAYGERRFAESARWFRDAAQAEPRSPDVWANAGTAAWAAGDTVNAAIGWQRALRLEPRATDLRVRLELLPALQDGWIAGVPPVALDWGALCALVLWLVACALAGIRLSGRARGWPMLPMGAGALFGAAASSILCVQLARVADAQGLAIVRGRGTLRAEPALGAESTAPVEQTDVARVLSRRSVWARVALDGGRAGWIEMERLVPLDR